MADLIIRAPNHLGDLMMALPALDAAPGADVLVLRSLAPLLELRADDRRILKMDRGVRGYARAALELRRRRYARGVLLAPSFSSALIFAAGGVRARRGTATDARSALLTERIPPEPLRGTHRTRAYHALVTGSEPSAGGALSARLEIPSRLAERWTGLAGPLDRPVIGMVPGSRAPARQWLPERYAELARRLAAAGASVVVFGTPDERSVTARVAGDAALDVGGRTDLPLLAAGLAACDLVVANDSGGAHLAAAVGTATVTVWGAGDPATTAPWGAARCCSHAAELPCAPCMKNECPRHGAGYVLNDAERECLQLVGVDEVEAAVRSHGAVAVSGTG